MPGIDLITKSADHFRGRFFLYIGCFYNETERFYLAGFYSACLVAGRRSTASVPLPAHGRSISPSKLRGNHSLADAASGQSRERR